MFALLLLVFASRTLNLEVGRTPGAELPGAVERALLLATGEQALPEADSTAVVATMPE